MLVPVSLFSAKHYPSVFHEGLMFLYLISDWGEWGVWPRTRSMGVFSLREKRASLPPKQNAQGTHRKEGGNSEMSTAGGQIVHQVQFMLFFLF